MQKADLCNTATEHPWSCNFRYMQKTSYQSIKNTSGLIPWPLLVIIRDSKEDNSSIHVLHVFWFDENRMRWCTASQLNLIYKKNLFNQSRIFLKMGSQYIITRSQKLGFLKNPGNLLQIKDRISSTRGDARIRHVTLIWMDGLKRKLLF